MNIHILTAIISSSVIASLISSLFTWFQNNKKNKLERITDERKQWRMDMRNYVEQFQNECDFEKAKNLLANLKVRINAFGANKPNDWLNDGHIWDLINKFERLQVNSVKEQRTIKDALIKSISCLLKHDWERSKDEIKGNTYFSLNIILCGYCIIVFLLIALLLQFELTVGVICSFSFIIILMIFICIYHYPLFNNEFKLEAKSLNKNIPRVCRNTSEANNNELFLNQTRKNSANIVWAWHKKITKDGSTRAITRLFACMWTHLKNFYNFRIEPQLPNIIMVGVGNMIGWNCVKLGSLFSISYDIFIAGRVIITVLAVLNSILLNVYNGEKFRAIKLYVSSVNSIMKNI